jgi:putative colanic acid biosynthesis acetyltransferase WcaB
VNTKSFIVLSLYYISNFLTKNLFLKIIGFPIRIFYKIFIQWILGIDIPDTTKIGSRFNIFHGQSLVINSNTLIGDNVTVRQNTTIGNARAGGKSPKICSGVDIGANCVIIGGIIIGENSIIAAGSVVVKNVPQNSIVAGNPAKVIKFIKS